MLEIDSKKRNYRFFVTDRLKRFISEKELFIDKRAQIGLAIKNRDEIVRKQYEDYKEIVDKEFERKLREKQMWDSFFMFTMKKCSNFSVPGSGKTASALGVYAYLHKKGLVKRIVMIGPINSFNSWIDSLKIITACSYADLVDDSKHPNRKISDHFPIMCEIEDEQKCERG